MRRVFGSPAIVRRLAERRAAPGLDPGTAAMLVLMDALHLPETSTLSPAGARMAMAESAALANSPETQDVTVVDRNVVGPAGELRARLYAPSGASPRSPGLVFFHGGGWVVGDLDSHDELCRKFAALGELVVLAVDYRLAPEHAFPAAAEDAVAAFRWTVTNAEALGMDPTRIGVAGDSAGGNLSAVVALRTRGDPVRPALAVLLYPAVDATCASRSHVELGEGFYLTKRSIAWYLAHYLGTDARRRRDPNVSPLLSESVAGAPATLIVAAAFDPLRDEAMAYGERLRAAGVPTVVRCEPGLIHGFALMADVSPAARDATARVVRETGRALRQGFA